ncbi:thioredoxin family protein [candidate division KSB1 bacterium]|nr:thioredoxin family protein [candidate division KSB1 bacterium]
MLNAFGLDLEVVENKFSILKDDVKLIYFTRESQCPHCHVTGKLLERIASVTHKVSFDSYNFAINREKDTEYHIFAVPALAIIGKRDYGIRYYGYPKGTEINDFLDDIIYVSRGENTLKTEAAKTVAAIKKSTKLKIFISPNCPFSLPVAKLALKLAIANKAIQVDIIHADEFLQVAEQYNVRGIPMTVVNEKECFYGALDEIDYVNHLLECTTKPPLD